MEKNGGEWWWWWEEEKKSERENVEQQLPFSTPSKITKVCMVAQLCFPSRLSQFLHRAMHTSSHSLPPTT